MYFISCFILLLLVQLLNVFYCYSLLLIGVLYRRLPSKFLISSDSSPYLVFLSGMYSNEPNLNNFEENYKQIMVSNYKSCFELLNEY